MPVFVSGLVLYPASFIACGKSLVKCVFNFGSHCTYVTCCDIRTIALFALCIIIRVSRAGLFTSPKLQVHIAKLKWWVASSIACWTSSDQPSLGFFKSLSQSLFQTCPWCMHCYAIWLAVSRSCRTEPKLITRFTRLFSVCDKRGWARDYIRPTMQLSLVSCSKLWILQVSM